MTQLPATLARNRLAPTLQTVAEAAGVHRSTASRALNPATRHLVAAEVARRVESVARGLGYRRNDAAASLRTRRSSLVGIVVPGLADPDLAPALAGLEAELSGAGYSAIVAGIGQGALPAEAVVDGMIARRVEAVILACAERRDPSVDLCLAAGVPIILLDRAEAETRVPAIVPDDRRGMRLVMAHLVLLGHRRIGHLAGPRDQSTGELRRAGFEEAVALAGLPAGEAPVVEAAAFTREAGALAAGELIDRHPDLTAIAAAGDLLALGAYGALAARGLRCPDDVSVTGHGDLPLVDAAAPPLTTVGLAREEMGRRAARLALRAIEGGAPPGRATMDAALVVRGSTGRPRAASGGAWARPAGSALRRIIGRRGEEA